MNASKRTGCLKPIFLGVVFVLVLCLLFIVLALSTVVTRVANTQLPRQLGTEATLGKAQVKLLGGKVQLEDLSIQQPEGFGNDGQALLTLERFSVTAPLGKAIGQDPVLVQNLNLSGLTLNLISDTNAVLNVTKLGPPAKEVPEEKIETEAAPVPPIWIQEILLENITIRFQDLAKEWNIELSDVEFEIRDLQISKAQIDGPGTVEGQVMFHSKKARGSLRLHARVGVITPDKPESVPPMQLAMGLIGFDLDLVSPFLAPSPAVAKAAFGGSGFDFLLFMQIDPGESPAEQFIKGEFALTTDGAHSINGKLGGNLAAPVLPFTTLFADILGNQFGRVTKLGENVAKGGLEAGKAVGETGVAAVKGVGKTVGGFAGGVLRSAKGVVTLDKDEALGGMSDATVGTLKNAAETVTDTAGSAGSGLANTAGTVTGGNDVKAWWANVEVRQAAFEETAAAWFAANPFPTVTGQ